MRIGIDVRCLMHQNYSGVAEYTYNLLDNIFKIDQKNQFILFYNSNKDIKANLPKFEYANVKYQGFKYPNKLLNLSIKLFNYPKIDKLLPDLDIFFIPNLHFVALSDKTKKVITIHDLSFERFPDFFSKKRNYWHKLINPQKLISQCDKIIAVSQNTKNDLIDIYKIAENKIKVIYSGVDTKLYKKFDKNDQKLSTVKEKYNLPDNFILYLGTIEPRKNIEGIIEAFNLLKIKPEFKNLKLIIAGDKGWKYEQVFKLAKNSPYTDEIKFIGYVDRQDKPSLYNLAQLFVFPSFYEGFGLPVLEAQACGLPVIGSLYSSFSEITNNSAVLVKPDNITELSQAIMQVLSDQNFKNDLINRGNENIERFVWQKTAQETLDYLTQ
jgi:glycosyltransferase involved in cell wall biosynthesis